jgi:phosphatidate cytidylyltransferase
VSRRGEDGTFDPHPGDPWHPEWHLEPEEVVPPVDDDGLGEGAGQTAVPARKRMGLFGRRRRDTPEEDGRLAAGEESHPTDDLQVEAEPPPWLPDEVESAAAVMQAATGEAMPKDEGSGEESDSGDPVVPGDGISVAASESAQPPADADSSSAPPSEQLSQEGPTVSAPSRAPAAADSVDAGGGLVEDSAGTAVVSGPPVSATESSGTLEMLEATEEEDWIAFVGSSGADAPVPPAAAIEVPRGRRRLFGSRKGDRREKGEAAVDPGLGEWQGEGEVAPPPWDPDQAASADGGSEAISGDSGPVSDDATAGIIAGGEPVVAGSSGGEEDAAPALEPSGDAAGGIGDADISDEEWERLFGGASMEPVAAPSGTAATGPALVRPAGIAPAPLAPPPGPVVESQQPAPFVGDTWAALRNVLDAETVEMAAPVEAGPAVLGYEPITGEIFSGAATVEHRGLAQAVAAADTAETELQALSAPMAGLDSGIVGFEDVVDLGSDEEYVAPAPSEFGRRAITGLVLVAMLLGALWVGGAFMAGFIGLIMFLGLTEYHRTLRGCGHRPLALFGYLGAIGLLFGTWFYGLVAMPIAIVGTAVVVFFYYALVPRRRDPLVNGGLTVLGVAWVTGTAAFAFPIVASPDARMLIIAVVAATVAMDVGAYSAGRSWGASALAPNLSPNKTVEGLAGGVVLTIGVSVALGYLFEPFDIRSGAALGLVVAAAAPLGDLAESMLKRSLGVKDMGSMLPGHGGILDRVDAFLFVLPAVWVLYQSLGLLG